MASFFLIGSLGINSGTAHAEVGVTQLSRQASDLLRHEATSNSDVQRDQAIAALCDVYVVLRSDDRFDSSDMLQGSAAKVRRRLLTVSKRRENKLKREGVERPTSLSREVDDAIKAVESSGEVPSLQFNHQAGAGLDDGWRLVELIQRIVQPDFWEPVGGNGTIHYFAMRRVLVVRATSDVHQQVKDLLMALR